MLLLPLLWLFTLAGWPTKTCWWPPVNWAAMFGIICSIAQRLSLLADCSVGSSASASGT
jgi:hypothetical protein